jgi:hypothetical protein
MYSAADEAVNEIVVKTARNDPHGPLDAIVLEALSDHKE